MSNLLTINPDLENLVKGKIHFPLGFTLIFFLLLTLITASGLASGSSLIFISLAGAVVLISLMIKYPKFWIYLIAASNVLYFFNRGGDVSIVEIILAFQYFGSLFFWFLWIIFVKREKILNNIADVAVMLYLIAVITNFIIAYLNDVDMSWWAREAASLSLVAVYFPIRKYLTLKKDLIILLIIYALVVISTSFMHFYKYSTGLSADIKYAYELAMGVRINQYLFTSASIFGFIFTLYQKSKLRSLAALIFTGISVAGLISTYSRTFWLILLFEIIIIIFYITGKQRIKFFIYSFFTIVILWGSASLFFKDNANIFLLLIENRLSSSTKGSKDVSVKSRFDEYKVVWSHIKEFPLAGNGIAKDFDFYNFILRRTTHSNFVHNGYLYVMYQLGIPIAILCFFPYVFYLIKGEKLARKLDDEFYKKLCLGSFLSIALMLISNTTTAQILSRDGIFVTALSFAFVGISLDKFENKTGKGGIK